MAATSPTPRSGHVTEVTLVTQQPVGSRWTKAAVFALA
jgi:hypothetical protein